MCTTCVEDWKKKNRNDCPQCGMSLVAVPKPESLPSSLPGLSFADKVALMADETIEKKMRNHQKIIEEGTLNVISGLPSLIENDARSGKKSFSYTFKVLTTTEPCEPKDVDLTSLKNWVLNNGFRLTLFEPYTSIYYSDGGKEISLHLNFEIPDKKNISISSNRTMRSQLV
jgi:hypothetical protein